MSSKPRLIGPKEKVSLARSASSTASSASISASSATRASSAWARGDLAFHSSHTDWLKSSGVAVAGHGRPAGPGAK